MKQSNSGSRYFRWLFFSHTARLKTIVRLKHCFHVLGLSAFVLMVSGNASASQINGWGFMRSGFFQHMGSEDVASLRATVGAALDVAPDTQTIDWTSADGKRRGQVMPQVSYQSQGHVCRKTAMRLQVVGEPEMRLGLHFCQEDGQWQVEAQPDPLEADERENATRFLVAALNDLDTGSPLIWRGEQSGHIAAVVMMDSPSDNSDHCRVAAISLADRFGGATSGNYRFCREAGEWRYAPE